MILDELVVHDFGVYGGRQTITLTPTRGRPITLFGGLNGGGKTTLLDALQLGLYGGAARCSNRNGLAYDDFLRRCVHRGAPSAESAIELAFRHTANGREQQFRLHRSWKANATTCRESFHVLRDGELDKVATEHWAEQVEDFIPARIAHLFLFDGEKVESYAELGGAPDLIATAIQNLLGLDIVERLIADLGVLERRKVSETKAPTETNRSEDLRAQITELEASRLTLAKERAAAANMLDRRRAELKAIDERYRREGGLLFEQRASLEAEQIAGERQLTAAQRELRDLAAGTAPLLMVRGLLEAVAARSSGEAASRRRDETNRAIDEEYVSLLASEPVTGFQPAQRRALKEELKRRSAERRTKGLQPIVLNLAADTRGQLDALLGSELDATNERLCAAIAHEHGVSSNLDHARERLAAAPNPDALAGILAAREATTSEVNRLTSEQAARDEQISSLERDIAQLTEREARLAEAEARGRFAQDDVTRMMTHSIKVRGTLGRFREAVIDRHVSRIERLVLESFQQLVRKKTLVAELKIDPRTFALELRGSDRTLVTPDRLSAGERQLLAIALLWGLGRASGRPLPTVIDTPLGRLDSVHRHHLVTRYFPQASHQVLLLSTDEEIVGDYYTALKPSINRTYRLRFDEEEARTIVEPGYLEGEVARAQ
jgi:DNA sulfur modification protein DndD